MTFPANFSKVTVTGTYLDLEGNPLAGTVRFEVSLGLTLVNADLLLTIMPTPVVVSLDTDGAFSVDLPATDDSDISPTGWTYTVTEDVSGLPARSYIIEVPAATSGSLDLSEVAPESVPASGVTTVAHGVLSGVSADQHHDQEHGDDDHSGPSRVDVAKAGTLVGTRSKLNLIEGSNVTLTVADSSGDDRVDVTIASSGGAGGGVTDHGDLTGLADDDHPQYAKDTDLTTHAAASDPHTGYVLETAHTLSAHDSLGVATDTELTTHAGLPNVHHTQSHADTDHSGPNRVDVAKGGTLVGTRAKLNVVEGLGVLLTGTDNSGSSRVDLTVDADPWQFGVFDPREQGLVGWNYDPMLASNGQTPNKARVYYCKVPVMGSATVAKLLIDVATLGVTLTSGQNLMGLYDADGNLLQSTDDRSTAWSTSTGVDQASLASTVDVTRGYYFVGILVNGTTAPGFKRFVVSDALSLGGAASSKFRWIRSTSDETSLPGTVDLDALQAHGQCLWVGLM